MKALLFFIISFFVHFQIISAQQYLDASINLPDNGAKGQSMDVKAADIDGDDDLDIILANEFQGNTILTNDGNGNFTNTTSGNLPQPIHDSEDIAIADFNDDGELDLVFCSEDDFVHEYYWGGGNGNFTEATFQLPNSVSNAVVTADFNSDSLPDLLFGNAGQNVILINDGDGSFTNETNLRLPSNNNTTQDLQLADVDGDDDLDIFVGNEDGNRLLINDGTGVFTDESASRLPQGLNLETRKAAFGDVDDDDDLDIFLSNVMFIPGKDRQNRLYINDGNGNFSDSTSIKLPTDNDDTLDGIFVDVDMDGDLDIYIANVMLQTISSQKVYLNDGFGNFTDGTATILPETFYLNALGVIAEDLNGDNLKDLYVCDRNTGNNLKDVLLLHDIIESVEDFSKTEAKILLFPNPVKDQFTVEMLFEIGDSISFKLFDVSGKELAILNPESRFANRFSFDISNLGDRLQSGNYFLQIGAKGKNYTLEFVLE